jgi:pimeloyl-ACP methyl ester carboxylesterase
MYSQSRAAADIDAILTQLQAAQAHVVGLSMGSYTTLHFALAYPGKARSIALVACGTGSSPDQRQRFIAEVEATVRLFESQGSQEVAARFATGPARVQFRNKDPRGWAEFARMFAEHSAKGSALTMRGTQMQRPSVWDLADDLKEMTVPTLLMTGDENEPALEANLFLKRMIPTAGLVVLPNSGLALNIEEPDAFNRCLQDFLTGVETGRWPSRDPQSRSQSALGVK